MSTWVSVLVILVLVAAAALYLRARGTRTGTRPADTERAGDGPTPDVRHARETDRLAHLTKEDRAWENASLQRNRESHERDQAPPGGG